GIAHLKYTARCAAHLWLGGVYGALTVHAGTAGDSLQRHFAVGVRYFTEVEKEKEQAVAVLGV
ncbi:hypothetical protein, partial [Pseudomonas putida]